MDRSSSLGNFSVAYHVSFSGSLHSSAALLHASLIQPLTTGRPSAIRIDVGLPFNGWRSRVAAAAS